MTTEFSSQQTAIREVRWDELGRMLMGFEGWNFKLEMYDKSEEYFSQIYDALSKASIPSVLRAQLLWLAPDHVHVYCEADGEKSVKDILVDIKKYFEQDLVKHFPKIIEDLGPGESLWDDGYFVESIG